MRATTKSAALGAISSVLLLLPAEAWAQGEPFPPGIEGEVYYAPRIDLLGLSLTLDGLLDEPAWERAHFQKHNGFLETAPESEEDAGFEFAALADAEYLYIAVRVADDRVQAGADFHSQCDGWQDDSIEIYIDALNDGPECGAANANCYKADDAQITVLRQNVLYEDPDELVFGGLAGYGTCDFSGPAPEVCRGVVTEGEDGDEGGWEMEVAIALETLGNSDDGTPAWRIDSSPGCRIGFSIQGNDDDDGGGRDTKTLWALKEIAVGEQAWRNPGVFGKLVFVDPTKPLPPDPVEALTCTREEDGTMALAWRNPEGADPGASIRILVDDVLVATLPGTATGATLSEAQVPRDDRNHTIQVDNGGCPPARCFIRQESFDECGAIARWNLLGAYVQGGGATPGIDAMRSDYLTDGVATEDSFLWLPGMTIATDFAAAASTSYDDGLGNAVPTVRAWEGETGWVNFLTIFRGQSTNVMAYAQCYVVNTTAAEIEAYWADASDDSIQVKLNGQEVWAANVGRGGVNACSAVGFPQDISPDGVTYFDPLVLYPGENVLLVKVFQGTGDWNFIGRFQTPEGEPLTEGLKISLTPSKMPVLDLACDRNDADGTVTLTWKNPSTADPATPIRFRVDGAWIARTVPGTATAVALTTEEVPRDGESHTVSVVNDSGYARDCRVLKDPFAPPELEAPGGKLTINCGRLEETDALGRVWKADAAYLRPEHPTSSATSPVTQAIDAALLSDAAVPQRVLGSERWRDGTIHYQLRVPRDRYRVTLYFAETCRSCVSQNLGGSNANPAAARRFDVEVEGAAVREYDPADAAEPPPKDGTGKTFAATELVFDAAVEDGRLDVKIIDLGPGNPPWNASVRGIAVERAGGGGEIFRRGDADGDGTINITDGIFLLNHLFLGGAEPPCPDAADANDQGALNITSAVYVLNYLFLGGPAPPAPGADACGPDPTEDTLDACQYAKC